MNSSSSGEAIGDASKPKKDLRDETAKETNQRDVDSHESEVKYGMEAAVKQQIKSASTRPYRYSFYGNLAESHYLQGHGKEKAPTSPPWTSRQRK